MTLNVLEGHSLRYFVFVARHEVPLHLQSFLLQNWYVINGRML